MDGILECTGLQNLLLPTLQLPDLGAFTILLVVVIFPPFHHLMVRLVGSMVAIIILIHDRSMACNLQCAPCHMEISKFRLGLFHHHHLQARLISPGNPFRRITHFLLSIQDKHQSHLPCLTTPLLPSPLSRCLSSEDYTRRLDNGHTTNKPPRLWEWIIHDMTL